MMPESAPISQPLIPVFSPWVAKSARNYVMDCLETGWLSSKGSYIPQFEQQFAAFCGTRYAVAVSNGTSALHLALVSAGIGLGDQVIVPSLTFVATANAVTYTGAKPIFADIDQATWTIDPVDVKRKMTPRTRAIIPVHLYGHPADMDPILEIARSRNLVVIEDAAQAHGALYKGKPVGGLGDMGCFSFYGNKILSTGEGGMLVTNNASLAERAVSSRNQAMDTELPYFHNSIGFNYRMSNLQAAVGCAQLEEIDEILKRKECVARKYFAKLHGIHHVILAPQAAWAKSVYWMFSVLIEKGFGHTRDAVMTEFKNNGIDTRPFFVPLHRLPPYATGIELPVTEKISLQGINLPSGPMLAETEVDRVCYALRDLAR